MAKLVMLVGISGSGKSTVAKLIAKAITSIYSDASLSAIYED